MNENIVCDYVQTTNSPISIKRYTTLEGLKDRQSRAKQELEVVEKAIAALEKNPDLLEIFDAVKYYGL